LLGLTVGDYFLSRCGAVAVGREPPDIHWKFQGAMAARDGKPWGFGDFDFRGLYDTSKGQRVTPGADAPAWLGFEPEPSGAVSINASQSLSWIWQRASEEWA